MKKFMSVMLYLTIIVMVTLSAVFVKEYRNECKFATNVSCCVVKNSNPNLEVVDRREVVHNLYQLLYANGISFSTIDGSLVWDSTKPFSEGDPSIYLVVKFISPVNVPAKNSEGERNDINNISAIFINPEDCTIYFACNEEVGDKSKIYFSHGIILDGETAVRELNQLYYYAKNC